MISIGITELLIAGISFLAGRLLLQSERVHQRKVEVYETYIATCATAHLAYKERDESFEASLSTVSPNGDFYFYASQEVIVLASKHINALGIALENVGPQSEALAPDFKLAIQEYNRMVRAMRRDVLSWSLQGIRERVFGSSAARQLLSEK